MLALLRIRWDLPWPAKDGSDRFPQRRTREWQAERWRLFTRYTLPSLWRQTHRDWRVWLLADPELWELHAALAFDDPRVEWVYRWQEHVGTLPPSGQVFYTRMDNDDALSPDALAMMVEAARSLDGKNYVQLDTGVAWHESSGELFHWVNPSPPFYGRPVPSEQIRSRVLPAFTSHGEARAQSRVLATELPTFCVTLHGGNVCNARTNPWCKDAITGDERERMMQRFGL